MKVEKSGKDIFLTPNEGFDTILIWLHGLGDSAEGYSDFFASENRPIPKRMKVILLTAPNAPVTVNGGMSMPSWFDIKDMTKFSVCENEANRNALKVNKIVENEAKNVNDDYSKIFIGGFSQGASLSLMVALSFKNILGGVVSCSGFLFPTIELTDDKKNVPIFAYHGTSDQVIGEFLANQSYKRLVDRKFNFQYKTSRQGHEISNDELKEMKIFLEKNVKISMQGKESNSNIKQDTKQDTSQNSKQDSKGVNHYNLGNELFMFGRYKDSIKEFTLAIKEDPKNYKYFNSRAQSHYKLKEYYPCIESCSHTINLIKDNVDKEKLDDVLINIYIINAKALIGISDPDEAEIMFRRAFKIGGDALHGKLKLEYEKFKSLSK